jgi:hypothetical protein
MRRVESFFVLSGKENSCGRDHRGGIIAETGEEGKLAFSPGGSGTITMQSHSSRAIAYRAWKRKSPELRGF